VVAVSNPSYFVVVVSNRSYFIVAVSNRSYFVVDVSNQNDLKWKQQIGTIGNSNNKIRMI
jgi:hypothetical protein